MPVLVEASTVDRTLTLRDRYRAEMNCQIVHDSIHRRQGWTLTYVFSLDGTAVGYASVAVGGPWQGKPTVLEFYLAPTARTCAFDVFERLLDASGARWMEIQSNDLLAAVMLQTYAQEISAEKIVFRDRETTTLSASGAVLHSLTSPEETRLCMDQRNGGSEWRLDVNGVAAATGGIMFHYNIPYGDIYMEVAEAFRGRGLGSFLVQELKRVTYELGAVPAARCNPGNVPSRRTLQKAGFEPYASILIGSIRP
jgi:GNAT superfamily N-acetyltransferase